MQHIQKKRVKGREIMAGARRLMELPSQVLPSPHLPYPIISQKRRQQKRYLAKRRSLTAIMPDGIIAAMDIITTVMAAKCCKTPIFEKVLSNVLVDGVLAGLVEPLIK
jgi:hypothetical protein